MQKVQIVGIFTDITFLKKWHKSKSCYPVSYENNKTDKGI